MPPIPATVPTHDAILKIQYTTDAKQLHQLYYQYKHSDALQQAIIRNPNASPDLLLELYQQGNRLININALAHPHFPLHSIECVSLCGDAQYAAALLANPRCPPAIIRHISTHTLPTITTIKLITHSNCPPDVLSDQFEKCTSPAILKIIRHHPQCPSYFRDTA